MQFVLDNVFDNNPYSNDNIVHKYHKRKHHKKPILMIRENINYFNILLSGNYYINPYRESSIILLEVTSSNENVHKTSTQYCDNSDVFNDGINTIWDKTNTHHNTLILSTVKLKLHLLKSLEKHYDDTSMRNQLKNILKPYYAYYNHDVNLQRWRDVLSNIPVLESHISNDIGITLFDLKILSLSYGINIIIFTQQNEHMINFLDQTHAHNDNPKINAVNILLNDIKTSKYLILNHRLMENANLLATIIINDKQIIPFNELTHNLQELIINSN